MNLDNKVDKQRYDTGVVDDEGNVLRRPLTPADPLVLFGTNPETIKNINKKAGDIPEPIADSIIYLLDYLRSRKEPKDMGEGGMIKTSQPKELEGIANLLATRGRYGDSMMVHMNPIEVQGLASMSPTGSLTINPDTGQPEAFLPFLLPLLGGLGGSALAGSAALTGTALAGKTALLGAVGSGLGTFAATGDLKQGLVSGLTGFGLGSAMNTVLGGSKEAALAGLKESTAAKEGLQQAIDSGTGIASINTSPVIDGGTGLNAEAVKKAFTPEVLANKELTQSTISGFAKDATQSGIDNFTKNIKPTERLGQMFSKDGFKALTSLPTLAAVGIGEGTNMQIRQDEMYKKQAKNLLKKKKADYESAVANRDDSYFPGYQKPYGDDYTQLAASGGIVSLDPIDFEERFNGLVEMGAPIKGMFVGGSFPNIDYNQLTKQPAKVSQGGLRGGFSISPQQLENTYKEQGLPGFGPEIMYFTEKKGDNPNPYEGWSPEKIDIVPLDEEAKTQDPNVPVGVYDQQLISQHLPRLMAKEITYTEYLDLITGGSGENVSTSGATANNGVNPPVTLTPEQSKNLFSGGMYGQGYGGYGFNLPFAEGGEVNMSKNKESNFFPDLNLDQLLGVENARNTGLAGLFAAEQNKKKLKEEIAEQAKAIEIAKNLGYVLPPPFVDESDFSNPDSPYIGIQRETPIINSAGGQVKIPKQMQDGGKTQTDLEADRLIELTSMAILGSLPEEESEVVIQAFVDEFGSEAFQMLRNQVLETVVPNSQKEGEIVGAGGGMDDEVMGMIGNQQPVAVSPGEYIVPADVVSGIGDGSTDAGVQELDGMLDRVRVERTNTTEQPAPLRKGGVLPR